MPLKAEIDKKSAYNETRQYEVSMIIALRYV